MDKQQENNENKKKVFIWGRKRVTECVYNNRLRMVEAGKKLRTNIRQRAPKPNLKSDHRVVDICNLEHKNIVGRTRSASEVHGRRIVDLKTLGDKLICHDCKEIISLQDVISEEPYGLASVLFIRCRKCLEVTRVPTDKQHQSTTGKKYFNINSKAVIGTLHAGMGHTHLNKCLAAMNIPRVNSKVYQTHVREVGLAAEKIAKDSCQKAAVLERQLTIKNTDKLTKLLPQNLQTGFVIPSSTEPRNSNNVTDEDVVRFAGSYDMGWTTRGTGRNYDSLNGFGAIVGKVTGLVLDYCTKNRKCRRCSLGHTPADHDCRLNFEGSAKAMEPSAAIQVTTQSSILRECNLEIGILIGDDDSSTIAAVRNSSQSEVVKHSDKNHTSKGVTKELYKLQCKYKELTKDAIQHLHRCFTYAVAQHEGDSIAMASAIRNIPEHCFNVHEHCGSWCKYHTNPESYTHSTIGEGFKDVNLFGALKALFDRLAVNTDRFAAGASSQVNESLNATMASKAPKNRCYSLSESADFRFACAVDQKNLGEKYISLIAENLTMSPGKNTQHHIEKVSRIAKRRKLKANQPSFKRRRLFLKKERTQLRNKKESVEGVTYSSNMGLLTTSAESVNIVQLDDLPIVVYFDLETSSFSKKADILQIAAKYENSTFAVYINPLQKIADKASETNGLRNIEGNLFLHGIRVDSVPLVSALIEFYVFLTSLKKKCILTAHNCSFDCPRLLQAVTKAGIANHFQAVVHGFADTLQIIKKTTGKKGRGENSLSGLAKSLEVSYDGAHNAIYDVDMLQQIIIKLAIPESIIIESSQCWQATIDKQLCNQRLEVDLKNLNPLRDITSIGIRKKIAIANITYEMILNAFSERNVLGVTELLGSDENGKVQVTKSKPVIKKLCDFLEKEM